MVNDIKQSDIEQIKSDLALIKEILIPKDEDGELTDWAKEELEKARNESRESYTSHEEVKRRIFSKK